MIGNKHILVYSNKKKIHWLKKYQSEKLVNSMWMGQTRRKITNNNGKRVYLSIYNSDDKEMCCWLNNEIFIIEQEFEGLIILKSIITKKVISLEKEKFLKWFIPAQAITGHKSQGQTLENIVIDLDDISKMYNTDMFNELYVCCSRVRSLENIFFVGSLGSLFWINQNKPLKTEKTVITDSSKFLAEICSSNGNGIDKIFNFLNGYLQETGEQILDQNCASNILLIRSFGPKIAHLTLQDLTERQLASVCNISKTSISRLIKEGLTREQIYLKFNPDKNKKVSENDIIFWSFSSG
jgi:hypothetical protein